MRNAIGFAAGIDEFALQSVLGRKGHGMQQQVQLAKFFAHGLEHLVDVFVLGHVAGQDHGVGAERAGQFLDVLLHPVALIGERQFGAFAGPSLGNGPGNGTFVGHAEDDSSFSCK